MCTSFGQSQAFNRQKMEETAWAEMIRQARAHLIFCSIIYEEQARRGDYFIHEHPAGASSWRFPEMVRLTLQLGVERVIGHMCAHGMWQTDDQGPGLIKKATKFLTNSPKIAARLGVRCSGGHRHIHLVGGGATHAQEYPEGLCRVICMGVKEQIQEDEGGRRKHISHDEVRREIKAKALKAAETGGAKEVREFNSLMHCDECGAGGACEGEDLLSTGGGDQTWEDVQGGWLDPKLVAKARSDLLS